jgi:hypothetical protein
MKIKNSKKIEERIQKAERVLPVVNELFSLLRSEGIEPTLDHTSGFLSGGTNFVLNEKDLAYRSRGGNSFAYVDGNKYDELQSRLLLPWNDSNLQVSDLAFEDGKVTLNDEFKRKAEDLFTYPLDTPEKVRFFKQLNTLAKSLNQMEELSREMGKPSICRDLKHQPFTCLTVEYSGEYLQFSPDPEIFKSGNQ